MSVPTALLDAIIQAVDTDRTFEVEALIAAIDATWPGSAADVRRELTLQGRSSLTEDEHWWAEVA